MKIKWPHFHSDPNWQVRNVHRYYQCRCGARRVSIAYTNLSGPVEPGWPPMYDSHGNRVYDTGWVKQ